jgi:hypothetical protein
MTTGKPFIKTFIALLNLSADRQIGERFGEVPTKAGVIRTCNPTQA